VLPRILGKSAEISPLVQIFCVLAGGGKIAGVVGAIISVSVIATFRILWGRMSTWKAATNSLRLPQNRENIRRANTLHPTRHWAGLSLRPSKRIRAAQGPEPRFLVEAQRVF
jgi:hypothetical protein